MLLVATIAFGVFILVGALFGFGPGGREVAIREQVAVERITQLPKHVDSPENVEVTVRVPHATSEQVRWAAGRDLAPGVVVVLVLWLLRGLLISVREGDPFTETIVKRLRGLALVVLIGVPLAAFLSSVFTSSLATSAGLHAPGTQLTIPGNALLGGLAAFVLAEVFAAGVRMRTDLEGTV